MTIVIVVIQVCLSFVYILEGRFLGLVVGVWGLGLCFEEELAFGFYIAWGLACSFFSGWKLLKTVHVMLPPDLLLKSVYIDSRSLRCRLFTGCFLRKCNVILIVISILVSTLHHTGQVLGVADVA